MTSTQSGRTTGIGSLPHHNAEAAIEYSFRYGVPFLPQLPAFGHGEHMIAQVIEGHSVCWEPFKEALRTHKTAVAKVQIAGPVTAQRALKLADAMETSRLVLARALEMSRELMAQETRAVIFLDEPGLHGLLPTDPLHAPAFKHLKAVIEILREEGVEVGLHCCGDADWTAVLGLPLHFLSLDTALSLDALLKCQAELKRFEDQGGRLSLGMIPTGAGEKGERDAAQLFERLQAQLPLSLLKTAYFTPACGLVGMSESEAEVVFETLKQIEAYAERN